MVAFLLDTDIISAAFARQPSARVLRRLARTSDEPEQFLSSVTLGELLYGAHRRSRADLLVRIDRLARALPVLSFDEPAARRFALLKTHLEQVGTPLDEPDLRIAAIAIVNDLTLVTGNVRHFARVPGLVVENWLDEDAVT